MVTITLNPESEIARALAVVDKEPLVLVSNGERFKVSRAEPNPADDYDPKAFREALRAAAGIFTPEEAEQLKRDIYRWREEGTRPINRP